MNELQSFVSKLKSTKDPFLKSKLLNEASKKGIDFKALSQKLGVNLSYLSHFKRLIRLPDMVVDGYYAGSISLSHLFVLSRLKNTEDIIELYEKILSENLTVKQAESCVREYLYAVKDGGKYYKKERIKEIIKLFKKRLSDKLSIKIVQTRVKVKIILEAKGNLEATGNFLENLLKFLQEK